MGNKSHFARIVIMNHAVPGSRKTFLSVLPLPLAWQGWLSPIIPPMIISWKMGDIASIWPTCRITTVGIFSIFSSCCVEVSMWWSATARTYSRGRLHHIRTWSDGMGIRSFPWIWRCVICGRRWLPNKCHRKSPMHTVCRKRGELSLSMISMNMTSFWIRSLQSPRIESPLYMESAEYATWNIRSGVTFRSGSSDNDSSWWIILRCWSSKEVLLLAGWFIGIG